jgi:hypothetical protein
MERRSWMWTALAVAALLVFAGVALYLRRSQPEAAAPPPVPQAVAVAPPKPADAPLPLPAESDARVRKLRPAISPRPELARWISEPDLIERWTVVADNLAEDVSPRKQLTLLAPAKGFSVVERKGRIEIDPRSYQRYDVFADVVASVDAQAFAAAARELHPILETAYHRLGYPDRSLDSLAQKALQRLIDAPLVEGAVELQPKGALYLFKDEKLQAQGPVEKHLLRMGPRNTRLIQAKARELADALGLKMAAH